MRLLDPCLCVFDVDRTLTGKQCPNHHHAETTECAFSRACRDNSMYEGVVDDAYDGGVLMISSFLKRLEVSFCAKECMIGALCSTTPSSEKARQIWQHMRLAPKGGGFLPDTSAGAWNDAASAHRGRSAPFLMQVPESNKHSYIPGIERYYFEAHGLSFQKHRVFFFDDESSSVGSFVGTGYNARQVACSMRDQGHDREPAVGALGSGIGLCGATPDEIHEPLHGVRLCEFPGRCMMKDQQFHSCPPNPPPSPHAPMPNLVDQIYDMVEYLPF